MSGPFKFGTPSSGDTEIARFAHANVWAREGTTGPDRLVIAPSENHVQWMIDLSRSMPGPFGILYVLVVSRIGSSLGRYQSPDSLSREDAEGFLESFEDFLEGDTRHSVWVKSLSCPDLLVYDRHNVIYAYGNLEKFETILLGSGLRAVDKIRFPDPHAHNYNAEFDRNEEALLRHFEWQLFPLRESVDL